MDSTEVHGQLLLSPTVALSPPLSPLSTRHAFYLRFEVILREEKFFILKNQHTCSSSVEGAIPVLKAANSHVASPKPHSPRPVVTETAPPARTDCHRLTLVASAPTLGLQPTDECGRVGRRRDDVRVAWSFLFDVLLSSTWVMTEQ